MDVTAIAKQAFKLVQTNKHLWFFGFFLAGLGGGGAGGGSGHKPKPGVAEAATAAAQHDLPGWLWPVLALAVVLGLVGLAMHVVSEAALIEGVRRRDGDLAFGVRSGFASGLRHFWRVLGVKALAALVAALFAGAIVVPILAAVAGHLPLWAGLPLGVAAALVAVPVLLTGYFLYEYALRVAVLEGAPASEAYRAAISLLHGRLVPSVLLLGTAAASSVVAGLASLLAALPAAAVGLALWHFVGLVPGVVAGVALLVPALVPIAGAQGTFRSAVWTLGFLSARKAA